MKGWLNAKSTRAVVLTVLSSLLVSCGGGGGGGGGSAGADPTPVACDGDCADTSSFLTVADVQQVIAQAVAEARAQNVNATIAVVDRVGNVLGIWQMAQQSVLIATRTDANGAAVVNAGLEGIQLPVPQFNGVDAAAAVAKAVTGAYLSSEGNAFTTRTANQIVQENFNPGETNQPSGPLFGVQFSQLPCSDFSRRFNGTGPDPGPKRSPLGLSADPGGLPLYKGGTAVGGVGVIADGFYSIDTVISDVDFDVDEAIALAATFNFGAPNDRRADRITVEGKVFRFTDVDDSSLASNPNNAPGFATLTAADGQLFALPGYFNGTIQDGTAFGTPASGIRPDTEGNFPGRDAFVFVDENNTLRYPPTAGTDDAMIGAANVLTAEEVRIILDEALGIANRARAQIRRPLSTSARVTISVVDTTGVILGMARTRDAPVFGADVSLQKARTATLFSNRDTATFISSQPDAVYFGAGRTKVLGDYVTAAQTFLNDANALVSGDIAFADRSGGNLSRPFFPDGIEDGSNGPFSLPIGEWSVFSTGLQLDLVVNAILQHVLSFVGGADAEQNCVGVGIGPGPVAISTTEPTLKAANGIQIFPGSVPIYRGNTLIGGIGVSGDGIDQDDMISFLGLHNAGERLGGAVNNAPPEIRADTLLPQGERLRYIQCPNAPFLDTDEQNVCEGK